MNQKESKKERKLQYSDAKEKKSGKCNIYSDFGKRLKTIRKDKGLTAKNLAELTGKYYTDIFEYESGRYMPNEETCYKIATALDVPYSYLMIGFGKVYDQNNSGIRTTIIKTNEFTTKLGPTEISSEEFKALNNEDKRLINFLISELYKKQCRGESN